MSRSLATSTLWFALASWFGYRVTATPPHTLPLLLQPRVPIAIPAPPVRCPLTGTRVTALTAQLQARAALGEPPLLTSYVTREFTDGVLVTLRPVDPHLQGGGGLIWVDAETVCVSVLKLYQ